jgi:hypothetical protein
MKKRRTMVLFASLLILSACTLPAPGVPSGPTPISIFPTSTTEPQGSVVPSASETPPPSATLPTTPTETLAPTTTGTASPTVTQPPAGTRVDATAAYGAPAWTDPMSADSLDNWSTGGLLPDTDNIRLALADGFLTVTGKNLLFDTWWFTWPEVTDFVLEMTVRVGSCSGLDSYGVIFRGPPRGVTPGHGYIAAFSCDGRYQVRRVDTTNPYTFVDLVGWTQTTAIRAGSNQTNVLGVRADGGTLTIYANGFRLSELTDNRFVEGRYGVFVRSGAEAVFTYSVDQIVHWVLED